MIAITKGQAVGKLEKSFNGHDTYCVRDDEGNYNHVSELLEKFKDKVVKITVEVLNG